MGMRPPRMCCKCHATAEPGKMLCVAHKTLPRDKERSYAKNQLKRLFGRTRWKYARAQVLFDSPICVYEEWDGKRCPELATDVHHKIRADEYIAQHGGDESMFYDPSNLEGLCHAHHSRHTAKEVGFGG